MAWSTEIQHACHSCRQTICVGCSDLLFRAQLGDQAFGQTLYWDTNGATTGSGNAGGTWDTTTSNWTTDSTGSTVAGIWVDGRDVVFSAGTDASNVAKTITLSGTFNTNSILLQGTNPNINLSGGTININNGVFNTSASGSSNALTWSSQITGTGGLTLNAHGDTSATGGGFGGFLHLSSLTSNFTGGVTIGSGVVRADSNFGDAGNAITLNGGGLVDTNLNVNFTRNIIVGASGGVYRTYGSVNAGQISGSITGSGVLRKTDLGTLRLSGNGSGFNGEVNIQAGNVTVSSANWSNTTFRNEDGNTLRFLTGTSQYDIGTYSGDRDVFIESGVTLNVASGNFNINNGTASNNFWVQGAGSLTSSSGTLNANWGTNTYDVSADRAIRVVIKDHGGAAPALQLVKNQAGGLILDQANTYTGGTTINAGRISASNVGAFGTGLVTVNSGGQAYLATAGTYANNFSIAGNGTTEAAGTLGALRLEHNVLVNGNIGLAANSRVTVLTSSATSTFNGTVSGDFGLEKTGAGTLVLAGNNTYTGATTVSAGTLRVTGANASAITVGSGATLLGSSTGSTTGLLTFNAGSNLLISNAAGVFTANGVNFTGATLLDFTTPITVGLTYDVLNYGAGSVTSLANISSTYRGNFTDDSINRKITFTYSSAGVRTWKTDSGTWDVLSTSNFTEGDQKFSTGDTVVFNNPSANSTVTLSGTIAPASISVNNTNNYTFSGSGSISGATTLTKSGTGSLTISNSTANAFTGGTTISAGTLELAGAAQLGAAGNYTGTIANNGTLRINTTSAQTLSGIISGSGSLLKESSGTLTLSGANTFSGNVTVSSGTLRYGVGGSGTTGAAGTLNTAVTKITVASGAAVEFNGAIDNTYGYTISGTGVGNTGALTNSGAAITTSIRQATNIRLAANASIVWNW